MQNFTLPVKRLSPLSSNLHFASTGQTLASTFDRVTDRLLVEARASEGTADPAALAMLLSTGEIASAAHLVLALQRAGVPARAVDPRDIALGASGERLNAELSSVDRARLKALFDETPVLILPGFFACAADGGLALLGRGGSDLTALFLASELHCEAHLLKDVPGLFEADPATAARLPKRFVQADYATAARCAGPLVQPKAIEFAKARKLTVHISSVAGPSSTKISDKPSVMEHSRAPARTRIGLLGLGTVGGGVLQLLRLFPERFEVVGAWVRYPEKHVKEGKDPLSLVTSFEALLEREPQILVEALPGVEPARTVLRQALAKNLRVASANKACIAADWQAFEEYLRGPDPYLRYAAAVGGAVPMLEAVARVALEEPIARLRGIVNGTCNFVLGLMAQGLPLQSAIEIAQRQGIAEADPTVDVEGADAAHKIELLGRLAFGGVSHCELVTGITAGVLGAERPLPQNLKRLVAEAARSAKGFRFKVSLKELAPEDFLAGALGAENRLEIITESGALVRLTGAGAGRVPTATALFADVVALHVKSDKMPELKRETFTA